LVQQLWAKHSIPETTFHYRWLASVVLGKVARVDAFVVGLAIMGSFVVAAVKARKVT
jgi:hypothetical protein